MFVAKQRPLLKTAAPPPRRRKRHYMFVCIYNYVSFILLTAETASLLGNS